MRNNVSRLYLWGEAMNFLMMFCKQIYAIWNSNCKYLKSRAPFFIATFAKFPALFGTFSYDVIFFEKFKFYKIEHKNSDLFLDFQFFSFFYSYRYGEGIDRIEYFSVPNTFRFKNSADFFRSIIVQIVNFICK